MVCLWHCVFCLLLLLFAGLLLPALSASKSAGISTAPGESVSILDRRVVGIFETVTLAAHDARELENWLRDNEYALPPTRDP